MAACAVYPPRGDIQKLSNNWLGSSMCFFVFLTIICQSDNKSDQLSDVYNEEVKEPFFIFNHPLYGDRKWRQKMLRVN